MSGIDGVVGTGHNSSLDRLTTLSAILSRTAARRLDGQKKISPSETENRPKHKTFAGPKLIKSIAPDC